MMDESSDGEVEDCRWFLDVSAVLVGGVRGGEMRCSAVVPEENMGATRQRRRRRRKPETLCGDPETETRTDTRQIRDHVINLVSQRPCWSMRDLPWTNSDRTALHHTFEYRTYGYNLSRQQITFQAETALATRPSSFRSADEAGSSCP